ncbi:MAG: branched-chain amino acid transport system substrate-binding protein [Alpinimonas sp.]|jgi:branched-chain amino acid transport system substrate-binding protein
MSSFSSRSRVLGGIAIAAASAFVLAGCAGGTTDTPAAADLTLNIGTVLPQTGSLAFLGPPEEAGVAYAVKQINDAMAGITVDVTYGDSGDTDNKAFETTVPKLLNSNVSAIIGAAASGVSKLIIDQVVGAGVLMISPANTSPDFTMWDDNGLYFRTAPSDLLQGEVLGNLIAADGAETLGILYLNDAYGTGLEAATAASFEAAGGQVVASESYNTGDSTFDAQISSIIATDPGAIAAITFDEFKTIAPALIAAGYPASKIYLVDGNLSQYGTSIPVSLEGAKGTLPGGVLDAGFKTAVSDNWVAAGNTALEDFSYAGESYDAVNLVALASLAAGSTNGVDIAAKMQEISGGSGTVCTSFAECADLINKGEAINYDGVSSKITFDDNGDPTEAVIGVYQYGADNMYTRIN